MLAACLVTTSDAPSHTDEGETMLTIQSGVESGRFGSNVDPAFLNLTLDALPFQRNGPKQTQTRDVLVDVTRSNKGNSG